MIRQLRSFIRQFIPIFIGTRKAAATTGLFILILASLLFMAWQQVRSRSRVSLQMAAGIMVLGFNVYRRRLAEDDLRKSRDELELRVIERSSELQFSNERLLIELAERKKIEDVMRQSEWEKTIMMRIAHVFLSAPDDDMYNEVLNIVREALGSRFGVFSYMAENGDLIFPTLTHDVWDRCAVTDKSIVFPPDRWGGSIWGMAIREKKIFRADGPFQTPEGHLKIDNFLTAPVIYGSETIGQISVANKAEGYTEADESILMSIADSISPILKARLERDRQEEARNKAEDKLLKLNDELEERVKQRTEELEAKIAEIERINRVFVGRELRMVELKDKIKKLEDEHDQR